LSNKAPACRACGNHPRTIAHRESCGIKIKLSPAILTTERKKRGAPKCRKCGNHPRSMEHRIKCSDPSKPISFSYTSKRKSKDEELDEQLASFIEGRTCVNCNLTFEIPFPEFQDIKMTYGNYDLRLQLPNTSKKYPLCRHCLNRAWEVEKARWGMKILKI